MSTFAKQPSHSFKYVFTKMPHRGWEIKVTEGAISYTGFGHTKDQAYDDAIATRNIHYGYSK